MIAPFSTWRFECIQNQTHLSGQGALSRSSARMIWYWYPISTKELSPFILQYGLNDGQKEDWPPLVIPLILVAAMVAAAFAYTTISRTATAVREDRDGTKARKTKTDVEMAGWLCYSSRWHCFGTRGLVGRYIENLCRTELPDKSCILRITKSYIYTSSFVVYIRRCFSTRHVNRGTRASETESFARQPPDLPGTGQIPSSYSHGAVDLDEEDSQVSSLW